MCVCVTHKNRQSDVQTVAHLLHGLIDHALVADLVEVLLDVLGVHNAQDRIHPEEAPHLFVCGCGWA